MKNVIKKSRTSHRNGAGATASVVHLEFTHPAAGSVCVVGTFNDWRPEATPMISFDDGHWMKELALPPGRYEYRLVVDDEWMPDPLVQETAPNPFGGLNSVLKVASRGASATTMSLAPAIRTNDRDTGDANETETTGEP